MLGHAGLEGAYHTIGGKAPLTSFTDLRHALGIPLRRTAVIATNPYDLPLLLEAGTAVALAGAGYECERAADLTLPAREDAGLETALRVLLF